MVSRSILSIFLSTGIYKSIGQTKKAKNNRLKSLLFQYILFS